MPALNLRPAQIVLAALLLWLAYAVTIWTPVTWPSYSPVIMNDGDTPLYTSYAVNLANCPLSLTHGVMSNLLGPDCTSLMKGDPPTYYLDHPSGMVWWVRLALPLFDNPIVAARSVNMMFAAGIILLTALFAWRRLGPAAGVGALAASLMLPIFWWHSVTVNLQAATSFFSVLMVVAFIEYDLGRRKLWLAVSLAAFALGAVTDWPTYFIAGPIGLYLLWQRRFGLFSIYFLTGIGLMAGTLAYFASLDLGLNMRFNPKYFFVGTFKYVYSDTPIDPTISNSGLIWQSFSFLRSTFSRLGLVILALPLLLALRAGGRQLLAPVWLFLACFYTQGLLNQFLFFAWAGSHNYWNFYYLPAALMSAALLINWMWRVADGKLSRQALVVLLIGLAVLSGYKSTRNVLRDYKKPPRTIAQTLEQNGLSDILNPDYALLSPDASPMWGQGFKLRLDIPRQLLPLSEAAQHSCDKTFTIYKASAMAKADKDRLSGIPIEEFDWYVIRGNPENPACR